MRERTTTDWASVLQIKKREFACGYCGNNVAADKGYKHCTDDAWIYLCVGCGAPTYFHGQRQFPQAAPVSGIAGAPDDIRDLFDEARRAHGARAHTAAVLVCRKILMHVAVEHKADPDKPFASYVEYLEEHHFIPVTAKPWVDYVRTRSNEANHEITVMTKEDSAGLLELTHTLLGLVYELPSRIPPAKT